MYCGKCGAVVLENAGFCNVCGNPVAQEPAPAQQEGPVAQPVERAEKKKRGNKRPFWLGLLAGLLCGVIAVSAILLWSPSSNTIEGKGYNSPEEAMTAYLEAMRDGDLEKAISTFAIESHVENYDDEAALAWVCYYGISSFYAPGETVGKDYNIAQRCEVIARNAYCQYLWFVLSDTEYSEFLRSGSIHLSTEEEQKAFLEAVTDPIALRRWQTLEVEEIMYPEDFLDRSDLASFESEYTQRNIEKRRRIYGAEQIVSCIARVRIDGETYLFFMDIAKYNGKWYNFTVSGNIGSLLAANDSYGFIPEE